MTQISVDLNKLSSFIYLLKLKIDNAILKNEINDHIECMKFIKNELIKTNNVFKCESDLGINNVVTQIFNFYYNENDTLPLNQEFKNLSLLN